MSSRRARRVPAVILPVVALILSLTASSPRAQGQGAGVPGPPPADGGGQAPEKPGSPQPPRYFEGRVLVKPRAGVRPVEMAPLHAALGGRVTDTFERIGNLQVVELPRGLVTAAAAIEFYRRSPLVAYAEPDYEMRIAQAPLQPNDLDSRLWGLHNTGQTGGTSDADIDAPEAWAVTTDASSVIVGVIDTGIDYTHPDLAANMWRNPGEVAGDGIDNDANGYVDDVHGINCITSTGNPMDDHYHGTHVAGTIGAVGDNGIGVVGVAWRVQLMALKFLDSGGSGSTTAAIRCINYAQAKGAHLTNNSWGGGGFTQALYDAINANRQAGMLFVAAAGNSSANTDSTIFYPAGYDLDNIVSVAASTHNDRLASFSNYGANTVELAAPGESILSTYPNNSYNSISGTSMASPHVAGALALLKAHRTDLTTYQALVTQLLASATPVPALATASRTGGRLNLASMLRTGPLAGLMVSARSVEPGVPVTFTDQSVGEITSRSLDFGDGTPPTSTTNTTHAYATAGTYTATLTVSGPEGTDSSSQTVVVATNYRLQSVPFAWVDSTGFTPLTLSDDSVSAAIPLPFAFPLYGQSYSALYVGSNGLLTLGVSAGATAWTNEALPSAAAPNAALYPLWDDLNAAVGGTVRHGTAPDGSYVVSWEGVPHYNSSTTTLTFQAVLEPSGGIVFQYFEVRPSTATYGAGRSATVGIEDATGSIAKQYSVNGSTLLANGTAIRFSLATAGPDAPGALGAAAPTASSVGLSWTDLGTTETGFWVQRKTDTTEFATVATLAANTTSYTVTGLSPLTNYTFRVVAFNDAGTAASNEVTVTTLDAPPAAPSNLALTSVSTTSVGLSWTDNASNETEVRVQRAPSGGTYADIATLAADATSYTDSGLTAGTAYNYRVVAANGVGPSPASNTLSVTTVPPAPVVTVGTVTATAVTLTWTNVAGETGYLLRREWSGGRQETSLGANTTTHTWSGLTSETDYTFLVVARNLSGESASVPVTATTLVQAPAAPTGLAVSAPTSSSLTLAWTDNATSETSYEVERTQGGAYALIASLSAGATSYTDTGRTASTSYSYRVFAVRNGVRSVASNIATGTTLPQPPGTPVLSAAVASSTSVSLSWADVIGETSYRVERTGASAATVTLSAGATTYVSSGLVAGATYSFRVVAVNTGGETASNVVNVTLPASAPSAPTWLPVANLGTSSMTVNWTQPAGAQSYLLERSTNRRTWTLIADTTLRSFTVTGLSSRTAYYYRVRAVNDVGISPYSSTLTAKTR